LNANGGIVIIGVKGNGTPVEIKDIDNLEVELKNYLLKAITPEAPISFSREFAGGKQILLVKVWNGSKSPYVFNGTIYLREGNQTVKAKPDSISRLIIERQKSELHWERQPALGIELEDLDELEIRKTLSDLEKFGRGKAFKEKEVVDFLTYYGLLQNNNLTNAAVVLFAKEPTRYLPQCRIRISVFSGSKSSDTITYDRILEGNLFRNIEETMQFFEVNVAVTSKFTDKSWIRKDLPYPKLALREGLMNALLCKFLHNIN
jgi:ATP-dependent DNA helicase RecG